MPPADGGDRDGGEPPECTEDDDCDDGVFCNGAERCGEGGACASGPAPCGGECVEEDETCLDCDADADGSRAIGCGGDDCDDSDARRSPSATEVCDAEDLDEDCDPTTFGGRDDDGDGYVDALCCNGTSCGDDCNDAEEGIHPTEAEMCNRIDDDCDGTIDENACSAAVAVASDTGHACAVGNLGTVWCWGGNDYGQIGDGSTTPRSAGTAVTGLTDAVEVDTDGIGYSCARTRSGDVRCWGGDDTCYEPEPIDVFSGMNVVDIDLWYWEMCALTADGRTLCVSFDEGCVVSPTDRCGTGPSDAVQIAVGGSFCCWRRAGGEVQCAGDNDWGQLGDGTNTSRSAATPVSGLGDAISIDAGSASACAVRASGQVVCWGDNDYDQLGRGPGAPAVATTPGQVGTFATGGAQVSVRGQNACALVSGTAWCWGRTYGATPTEVSSGVVSHVSAGARDDCFVREGSVYCRSEGGSPQRVNGIP